MEGKAGFGRLFAASRTLRSVAVVQRAIRWVRFRLPRAAVAARRRVLLAASLACEAAVGPRPPACACLEPLACVPDVCSARSHQSARLPCKLFKVPLCRLLCSTCPVEYMADLGFGELVLVESFAVSMSGAARVLALGFQACPPVKFH